MVGCFMLNVTRLKHKKFTVCFLLQVHHIIGLVKLTSRIVVLTNMMYSMLASSSSKSVEQLSISVDLFVDGGFTGLIMFIMALTFFMRCTVR